MATDGLPIISLKDQNPEGNEIPLEEIDPFTIFAVFNRSIKTESRIEIIRHLKDALQLSAPVPQDFAGIPVVNLQKAWFVPYKFRRKKEDVTRLWDFAKQVVFNEPKDVDARLFEGCLEISQVGVVKLTMGMFWLQPDRYLALDRHNVSYLESKGIDIKLIIKPTLPAYLGLVRKVQDTLGISFPEVSYRAWVSSSSDADLDPKKLDDGFRELLEKNANLNGLSIQAFVQWTLNKDLRDGENEITNRVIHQDELARLINSENFTEEQLKYALSNLWSLQARIDIVCRNSYFSSGKALADIKALLAKGDDSEMPQRINQFIEVAIDHGYKPKKRKEALRESVWVILG